jgi:7-alpha-hydroxysteroid dehydrogenase
MILDRFRVTDRGAVVTGAGRGIGAAIAVALAEAGADVVISSRTEDELAEVGERIEAAGRRAVVVPADLSDLDAAAGLAATAHGALGRLDIVVNNMGGSMPRPFAKTATRHLEQAFQFNVATAHALTHAAVPFLLEGRDPDPRTGAGTAAVVNVTSVMGRATGRGYLAYGTAKAALSHYTRLAARDLAPRIRVNAIGVGSIATAALDVVLTDADLRTTMEQTTPLRRIGDPDDIAAVALFLASDAGAYVTGTVVDADGGLDRPNLDLGFPDV